MLKDFKRFRPIILCNVIYKIIIKALANRIKPILRGIISTKQESFFWGTQIVDGIIELHEVIHSAQTWKKMSSSFNWICRKHMSGWTPTSWTTCEKFWFSSKWRNWIIRCITTAWFSIMLNGEIDRFFHFQRGLRQGASSPPTSSL